MIANTRLQPVAWYRAYEQGSLIKILIHLPVIGETADFREGGLRLEETLLNGNIVTDPDKRVDPSKIYFRPFDTDNGYLCIVNNGLGEELQTMIFKYTTVASLQQVNQRLLTANLSPNIPHKANVYL